MANFVEGGYGFGFHFKPEAAARAAILDGVTIFLCELHGVDDGG
jgi:hypothetical protein